MPIKLVVIDAKEEREPVSQQELDVDFPDPIVVVELALVLGGISFPAAGEYRVQLFAGDEFVIERRLLILDAREESQ